MSVELSNAQASVHIAPNLGASVLSYSLSDGQQIFRPRLKATNAFNTACYVLTPWCNRIDGGVILPDGTRQAIAPTHSSHQLPIHGSAAHQAWKVEHASSDQVTLSMNCDWPEPFHYNASVQYSLIGAALSIVLSIRHLGKAPLPHGLGLHPWFVRTPSTQLQAAATHWQQTDERLIPVADMPVDPASHVDFKVSRLLPDGLIDTAFGGWDGVAELKISSDLTILITTKPALKHYQLYSMGRQADFVCFEPVTHPVNAHNMRGFPGLRVLSCGETTSIAVHFCPRSDADHTVSA